MKKPESRPFKEFPKYMDTDWREEPEIDFFNETKNIRRNYIRFTKENINLGKIKSSKIDTYLKLLSDLEVAREFIRLKENRLDKVDPEWLTHITTLSCIRYSLGGVQTYFLDRLYSLIDLKRKLRAKKRSEANTSADRP